MDSLWKDIRFGARVLWKAPAFTAVALFALVLGIGANTAIFSVVNAVFLKPLPFRDADRLVMVWEQSPHTGKANVANPQNLADWMKRNHSFEDMAAFIEIDMNLTGEGGPERVLGSYVTRDFFPVLGVAPILGRNFVAQDEVPGGSDTILLSYGLWKRRYGGDPGIIGKQVRMGDRAATVAGVMSADFRFPGSKSELWNLLRLNPNAKRGGRFLTPIARLKPGVTFVQAQAEMKLIGQQLAREFPEFDTGWGVTVVPMREQFIGDIRAPLLVLLGAVGMVLLIACANVANLTLMRSSVRQREMAIRSSLGASRMRIIRQILIESGMLGLFSGALGLLAAIWVKDVLLAMLPDSMSVAKVNSVTIDLRVLTFTFVMSVGTALLFGLLPALRSSRPDYSTSLKEGGRGVLGSLRKNRLRAVLVAAEMAIALTLLIGSGLLIKSFFRLENVSPGFNPEHLLTMRMKIASARYKNDQELAAGLAEMMDRVQRIPGVTAAGAIHFLPLSGLNSGTGFHVDGQPVPKPGSEPVTAVSIITPGYLKAMGIPLIKGRALDNGDVAGRPQVTIVNEALAKQFFPNTNPIGQRLFVQWGRTTPYEIVGVVGDVKHDGLDKAPMPAVYFTYSQEPHGLATIVVRTGADPMRIARAVQDQIHSWDKDQAVADVQTMETLLSKSVARPRFQSVLLGTFAGLALLLATIGIFGVMSYSVTQRTHEIGIRMALGAESGQVVRLVVGQALTIAVFGAAGGLAGAFALTRYLRTLLFEVSATDAATFVVLPLLMCAVAVAASYLPARRAAQVDPISALRYE
jgi:putative ABC transport system permease protein